MAKKKHTDDETPGTDASVTINLFGPPPNLSAIISFLFAPAPNAQAADMLLSAADLFDTVSQHCEASKQHIFDEMILQNFRAITIEGEIYWMVMEL